jgi:hypothetical protein
MLMQDNFPDMLLTRDQVQAEFGLTRRFLELSAWRGNGPPMIKLGRAVRYKRRDIQSWIDARRIEPERFRA